MFWRHPIHRLASVSKRQSQLGYAAAERLFSFNFAGPKQLDDILKKELVEDKNATEVADIWYTYHENKVRDDDLGWEMPMIAVSVVSRYAISWVGKCARTCAQGD